VVEASKQIVNVFVDCDWGKKNTDLSGKYGVRGYPTVIFTDSAGTQLEKLNDRSPDGVRSQIASIATKYVKSFDDTWEKVSAAAIKDDKLVLFLFATNGDDSAKLNEALNDEALGTALELFAIGRTTLKRDSADAKRFGVSMSEQPVLLVLDPKAAKPEAAPLKKIVGRRTAKELLKELASIKKPKGV
jgi:hypothetical protein